MSRSNCVVFALRLYVRRVRKGREGYLMWRRSRLRNVLGHVLYAEQRRHGGWRVVSWCPIECRPRMIAPPWFRGRVRHGDKATEHQ
jgi:hypothetical protein